MCGGREREDELGALLLGIGGICGIGGNTRSCLPLLEVVTGLEICGTGIDTALEAINISPNLAARPLKNDGEAEVLVEERRADMVARKRVGGG